MVDVKKKITTLPTTPGVYIYKDESTAVIYVGKAVNLKRRVHQYFESKKTLSPKTQQLVKQIAGISYIKTVTEFDALLLEANLIQKFQPKYNMIAKDDKSPIYIKIPIHDSLPRITLARKPNNLHDSHIFYAGPFQSTRVAKSILRSIRQCVPFCTQKIRNGKPCFYTHIGLCTPCPSYIEKLPTGTEKQQGIKQYKKNISRIIRILKGNIVTIINEYTNEMHKLSLLERYEEATLVRDKIENLRQLLQTHFDPSLYLHDMVAIGETIEQELRDIHSLLHNTYPNLKTIHKIECIDISNTSGSSPVGSLVVMIDGIMDRAQYRKFAIYNIHGPNDTHMIHQVMERRLKHTAWSYPDLLLIDGGKGQVKAALSALTSSNIQIPVIGLAKRYESIVIQKNNSLSLIHLASTRPALRLLERIRDESHRFAIAFHIKKRAKNFI